MKKNKKLKILTTIGLCLITGISTVKAIDYPSYKSDYTKNDINFTTNDRTSDYTIQKLTNWYKEGLSKYAVETREGQPYYMKGPADSEYLRRQFGEIKNKTTGKVIGYRWYDLAWYVIYSDSGGNWITHNVYGDSGDASGIKPGATGNFYLSVDLNPVINYLQETYGVTVVEKNVKIYGYEKIKTAYGETSQNFLQAYGLPTVTEGTIDWANKKGNLSFRQFTTNSGNIYGLNSKYNYQYLYGTTYPLVRSHGYYVPYMLYILFDECEYTIKNNFPTDASTTDRKCCTYYETESNYKKIPGYKEGMTKEQALELLYQDYPHCRIENKCTIDLLPTLTSETNPSKKACCESLLEQYKDDPLKIDQITPYCRTVTSGNTETAGISCTEDEYRVNVDTPTSCTDSTTGTISDITNWGCIFDSTNQAEDFEYDKFYIVESTIQNPYCSVYCREEISYEFPTNSISVEAGKHFTVNNNINGIVSWDPINFTNKRECRTYSSLENQIKIQMGVDEGYKKLYEAVMAYKNFIDSDYGTDCGHDSSCQRTYESHCIGKKVYHAGYARYVWEWDCSTRDRYVSAIRTAQRNAKCIGKCDFYEEIVYLPKPTFYGTEMVKNKISIGYNYLVSGKINVEQFVEDWNYWNDKVDEYWKEWKTNKQFDDNKKPVWSGNGTCTNDNGEEYTEKYTKYDTFAYYGYDENGKSKMETDDDNDACGSELPWAERARVAEENYRKALEERQKAEDYIWACNNWEDFKETGTSSSLTSSEYAYSGSFSQFIKYDKFSPDIILNYNNSDWIYHYNDLLDKTLEKQDVSVDTTYYKFATAEDPGYTYTQSLNAIFENKYQTDNGENAPLGTVNYEYPINEEARSEIEKSYSYHLPDGQYQYILKPEGSSVNKKPTDKEQAYINLGYANLPVHFMTPEGSYPITLTYNKFSDKENLEHKFDDIVFGTNRNQSLVYSCNYYVENNIIDNPGGGGNNNQGGVGSNNPYDPTTPGSDDLSCILRCNGDQACIEKCPKCVGAHCVSCTGSNCDDWRGLAIIYRPISLENPFPGMDGETREPGSNWKSTKVTVGGETKYLYISSNRNVSGSEIYHANVRPMYSFTLTPAVIMQIREYNDSNSYGDFNMKCLKESDGMWKECKSNFLRNQAGTGTNWQVQIGVSAPKSWVDWDTCGMQDKWEECALEDEGRS